MRTPINRSTAYEPQANRTTYDTVFNSDAAQMIKFEPRIQIRTNRPNWFEPRAWLQTFTCIMTQTIANLTVLAGKLHYVTFGVITRNITRLSKTRISCWFIRVFDEPGFLLSHGFSGQSIGQCVCLFFSVTTRFIYRSVQEASDENRSVRPPPRSRSDLIPWLLIWGNTKEQSYL